MMMFWITLLIWAVTTVIAEIIRPKPEFEDARPTPLGDFQFPTATEGRSVPLIWGRVKVKGPNLIWYGNFFKTARTEKVKTGMFSSENVIIGYKYNVGMQFAVCHGPVDAVRRIWINDKSLPGSSRTISGSITIDSPNLFGGDEHGQGGMLGVVYFYKGADDESTNTYLSSHQDPLPAYRGICHFVWQGGYVGNSGNISPWAFELERIPDGLNMAATDPGDEAPNDYDANPMNVLYEVLTNTDWGLSILAGDIDVPNFKAAASTLADEGNGFSMVLDGAMQVTDLINEIQRQIDGSLFFNRATGQWQVKLARADYDPGSLDVYDETNIVKLTEFTRQTWEETTNQVRVAFTDRDDEFKSTFALAQDPANMGLQGQSVVANINYPGCMNAAFANKLAWRDLKALSYPLAKIKFTVNREAWNLGPGAVFKFSWSRLGVSELVFRVGTINYGKVGESAIEIFAIQDIFAAGIGTYGDPIGTGWEEPTDDPAYALAADTLIVEAPRQLVVQDPYSSTLNPRAWMGARWPGDGTVSLRSYNRVGTSQPVGGDLIEDSSMSRFILVGTLDNAIGDYSATPIRPWPGPIDVDELDLLDEIAVDGGATLVSDLTTIAYIDGEYIGFEQAEDIGGGVWRLARIWRGLFHTAAKAHDAGTRIWFMGQGGGLSRTSIINDTYDEMDIQLRGRNGAGDETTEGETPVIDLHLDRIWRVPLAPTNPTLNGAHAPASEDCDTLYTSETGRSGDDARALEVKVSPRDWRQDLVTHDYTLNADYLDDDPEFDFYLYVDPDGDDIEIGPITIDSTATPAAYVLRNSIIVAVGANKSIHGDGRVDVVARHTLDAVERTNPVRMTFPFTLTSALQSADDVVHGKVDDTLATAVIYGETGNYTFDIHTALPSSGIVEYQINSGGWFTLIGIGNTSAILAVTAADSIQLRWQTSGPVQPQFFDIVGPTAELGYGVLEA